MLGTDRDPVVIDEMLVPPAMWGVRCISIGYFVPQGQAVIWRGPMLHKALEQFLTDVFWDEPDFLLVDMPPGTGDIALSLAQFLPRAELLVVTTPQPAAQKVAQRAAYMAFTGTPLLKNEKTKRRFGSIVHAYPMQQAVEDQAVVPLLYEERRPELDTNAEAVDAWFDRITEGLTEGEEVVTGSYRAISKDLSNGEVVEISNDSDSPGEA